MLAMEISGLTTLFPSQFTGRGEATVKSAEGKLRGGVEIHTTLLGVDV